MTTLHEAIKAGVAAALRGLYIGMPGQLESYDAKTGRGVVKPLIQEPDPSGNMHPIKPIAGVPVVMPGGDDAALYIPPTIGGTGWISFSHRSMENWLDRGGDATPGDPRVMDLTDAVFWPGLRPFSDGSLAEEADALVLRNGKAKLKIRGGKIALGNASLPVLPAVPPITGRLELINLIAYLVDRLADPTLVIPNVSAPGTDIVNPLFTAAMQALKANLSQIQGDL